MKIVSLVSFVVVVGRLCEIILLLLFCLQATSSDRDDRHVNSSLYPRLLCKTRSMLLVGEVLFISKKSVHGISKLGRHQDEPRVGIGKVSYSCRLILQGRTT